MKLKMRKWIMVFASLLLLLSGCAQMNSNTANASDSPVIDRIMKRGELVVVFAVGQNRPYSVKYDHYPRA